MCSPTGTLPISHHAAGAHAETAPVESVCKGAEFNDLATSGRKEGTSPCSALGGSSAQRPRNRVFDSQEALQEFFSYHIALTYYVLLTRAARGAVGMSVPPKFTNLSLGEDTPPATWGLAKKGIIARTQGKAKMAELREQAQVHRRLAASNVQMAKNKRVSEAKHCDRLAAHKRLSDLRAAKVLLKRKKAPVEAAAPHGTVSGVPDTAGQQAVVDDVAPHGTVSGVTDTAGQQAVVDDVAPAAHAPTDASRRRACAGQCWSAEEVAKQVDLLEAEADVPTPPSAASSAPCTEGLLQRAPLTCLVLGCIAILLTPVVAVGWAVHAVCDAYNAPAWLHWACTLVAVMLAALCVNKTMEVCFKFDVHLQAWLLRVCV